MSASWHSILPPRVGFPSTSGNAFAYTKSLMSQSKRASISTRSWRVYRSNLLFPPSSTWYSFATRPGSFLGLGGRHRERTERLEHDLHLRHFARLLAQRVHVTVDDRRESPLRV